MGNPQFKFTLGHILTIADIQLTNNEFATSINNWDQINSGSDINFSWNSPSSARASGASANTSAIGQGRVYNPDLGWPSGTYTVAITATNTSTGGSSPFTSGLNLYGSDTGAVLDDVITFSGTASWDVGAGTITRTITFTLTQSYKKLFFKFVKQGPSTGYNVVFTIDSIILSSISNTSDTLQINEPNGWRDAKLILERHPDFHTLVEYFESGFVFYGGDGSINGGIDFIRRVERDFGVDANISLTVDLSFNDGVIYNTVFQGLLKLADLQELPDNKMEVPVIRNSLWSKFISRLDTPVSLSSTVDLDGNAISSVEPLDINLPSQKITKLFSAENGPGNFTSDIVDRWDIPANDFGIIDLATVTRNEIEEKFTYPNTDSPTLPFEMFSFKYGGRYQVTVFLVTWGILTLDYAPAATTVEINLTGANATTITLTRTNVGTGGIDGRTTFSYSGIFNVNAGDKLRLYFENTSASTITITMPKRSIHRSYIDVVGYTTYPSSEVKGYYLHDAFAGVINRIIGTNSFYSDVLGRTDTNMRTYSSDGCYSPFVLIKGLQLRGYLIEEKPFFVSFNDLWNGANPILNLSLGYSTVSGSEVIRLEKKEDAYIKTISKNISNLNPIREYDNDVIYKKINIGYSKWQSENISGIDDPQTKHTYATRFEKIGTDITLHSEFVAASLAIETTRRTTIEKSKDYKFDDEIFIIHFRDANVSPDRYAPELMENFNSVSNLNNSETRYNLLLTPLYNFLRWANHFNGCLQKYKNSKYRFVSGEGNYDMVSDYSCSTGDECLAKICDPLSEKGDIDLGTYNSTLGYLHLPDLLKIDTTLTWEDYETIRNNRANSIGVSRDEMNHKRLFIKKLEYKICESDTSFEGWLYDEINMGLPESTQPTKEC